MSIMAASMHFARVLALVLPLYQFLPNENDELNQLVFIKKEVCKTTHSFLHGCYKNKSLNTYINCYIETCNIHTLFLQIESYMLERRSSLLLKTSLKISKRTLHFMLTSRPVNNSIAADFSTISSWML